MGVFSFGAASIAKKGQVIAAEADWLSQLIQKSIAINKNRLLNISVLPCAISDKNGMVSFLIANRGRASNTLETVGGRSQTGGFRNKVCVPTLTLDTLLEFLDPLTSVKIDVEGAENLVLKGAKKLLSDIRPYIYIEVGKDTNNEVTSILIENDYCLFNGFKSNCKRVAIDTYSFNTIAIPRGKDSQQEIND